MQAGRDTMSWPSRSAARRSPNCSTFIGTHGKRPGHPGREKIIRAQISAYHDQVGGFDIASLQVNFGLVSHVDAAHSMRLFAQEVMPYFREAVTTSDAKQA
jgi:hypothetical protein